MITLKRFARIERAVRAAGFAEDIDWSEALRPPASPDAFGEAAVYVICNSGMRNTVALRIVAACMGALRDGRTAASVFGHSGKAAAIDHIWAERADLFGQFTAADDKVSFCEALPWVGPVTKFHLAKDLGVDAAKPDVHLERLARAERTTTAKLCARLAKQTGYRVATIDTILWRACEQGILNSRVYEAEGWRKAFQPHDQASE
jgi:hypothetical protein